ncbi:MAG: PEP-utilizing enzyme [Candidatus Freyarchaeum deiterrae]
MPIVYDAIWGFKEDILEVRGRFKEQVLLAHLSQPMGIPLHKYEGKVTLDENKIALSGKDKDTQQTVEFIIPRQNISELYLGWDDAVRRLEDTRAVIKPLRITFRMDDKIRVLYLYAKGEDTAVYGKENKKLYEEARPITVLRGHNPAAGEWNDSLAGDYLWTRANYGEAVPDVMTPCTWSLVQILLENMDLSFGLYRTYGNIGGCLYKNLSMDASFAAVFGINQRRVARMIEHGFGRLPKGLEIPIVRLSRGHLLRVALPVVVRGLFRMWANHKKLPAFLQAAPGRCEALRARIQAAPSSEELVTLWHTDVAPFFYEACHMLETAVNSGGDAILSIRRDLQKLVGEDDTNVLLTGLSTSSGPLASLGPLLGLTRLAQGKIDRETFARKFGHRGPHEMEVSIPRPGEQSNWIDKQLAGLRQAQDDATALLARQETKRKSAWDRLCQRYPRKETSIRRKIDRWAAITRDREAARSEVIRTVWVLRSFVQRAGMLTGQGENIFFLSIDEILSVLGGDQTSLTYIPARRAAYKRYCALPPYPVLIRGRFDPFQWATNPERRSDMFNASRGSMPVKGAITGFPGAAGVVEGKVRVIATAEDGDQLQAGEILVTTVTNVGWTPLFPCAAAVVTDVGAPLSHAAIVAREFGIPAVVGCGDATMRLKTGDWVRVDGGKGLVEIISAVQHAV